MDSQLHLPGPHLCPVCNVVHKIGAESLPRNLAELLRPYYATYTPSKFPPTGDLVLEGTVGSPAAGSSFADFPTFSMTTDGLGITNSSAAFTINKAGDYLVALAGTVSSTSGVSQTQQTRFLKGASVLATSPGGNVPPTNNAVEYGLSYRGSFAVSDVLHIQMQKTDNTVTGSGTLRVVFIPISAHPQ